MLAQNGVKDPVKALEIYWMKDAVVFHPVCMALYDFIERKGSPDVLHHGTASRFLDNIRKQEIQDLLKIYCKST